MIGPDEIERLSGIARKAGVAEIDLSDGARSLRLRIAGPGRPLDTAPAARQLASAAPKEPRGVKSPGVGLFRHAHPVTGRPASPSGQRVAEGQVVGYVQTGSCLRPATAPCAGTIGAPVHEEGALVGYGTLLYRIE